VAKRNLVIVLALVVAPMTMLAQSDAMAVARIALTVDGGEVTSFSEFGGVVAEARTLEFFDSSAERRGLVTLSRLASSNVDMWTWHESTARKPVRLFLYNRRGDLIMRYHLESAWPAKVEIGLKALGASEVLMETITIVSARITRVGV
jgi:hypothetical protein